VSDEEPVEWEQEALVAEKESSELAETQRQLEVLATVMELELELLAEELLSAK
jgi:hypothetical protein